MDKFAAYPNILTMGSVATEKVFQGDVTVEEKVDGSFFCFGATAEGEVVAKSKNKQIDLDAPAGMFQAAIDFVNANATYIARQGKANGGVWFFCEFLATPKHNTLFYEHVPTNHLVLFDAIYGPSMFASGVLLEQMAGMLGIDSIPILHQGPIDKAGIEALLSTPSYLGRETIEGVVIKNYDQLITLNSRAMPLFVKRVRTQFRERNNKEWSANSGRSKSEQFIASFESEARWEKAIQHFRDDGRLLNAPQDIGPLIAEIERDILEEESENIKRFYFNLYKGDIIRAARKGFPEWYKERLAKEDA